MDRQKELWQDLIIYGQRMKTRLHGMLTQIASKHDVTVHQLMLLLAIHDAQVKTIGDVSRELEILQANASALCKRMETLGYVRRKRNDEDVRVVNLDLTPEGEEIVKAVLQDINERCQRVLDKQVDLNAIKNGFEELSKLIQVMEGGFYEQD